ncbi:MAG: hypothetical protein R3B90_00980 [Planctomycetaceae bacterium]
MTSETSTPPVDNALADSRRFGGRALVFLMLGFGVVMTGIMFAYWELYTREFRPLQAAIAAEFPESTPRAIGGTHKSHLPGHPSVMRIIIRVDFDPRSAEQQAREAANRLTEIARRKIDISKYQVFEIFLTYNDPERLTTNWRVAGPIDKFPLPLAGSLPEDVLMESRTGEPGT